MALNILCSLQSPSHSNSDRPTMRSSGLLLLLFVKMAHANTFKVFHNTFDPAVFGTTGGAHHNATGDGYVDALSICIRFQVLFPYFDKQLTMVNIILLKPNIFTELLNHSLPLWLETMKNGSGEPRFLKYQIWRQAENYLRLQLRCTSASLSLGTQ